MNVPTKYVDRNRNFLIIFLLFIYFIH